MRIIWTLEAADDLEAILSYISARNPTAAASTAMIIDHALNALALFPGAGRLDALTRTREWPVPNLPLLFVYTADTEAIEIIALFHTARDPAQKRGVERLE